MSQYAIETQGISKQYRLGAKTGGQYSYKSLRDVLTNAVSLRWLRAGRAPKSEMFWALRDVSFGVKHGEVIGIIGRNGAGKSTLLKVLSRVTDPSAGRVIMQGRIGSLLEVGTGFHPELSGRENILMNGAILGMKKAEIDSRFDEIVAFSEVEKFIDTPVKHYSSGMYLRLAFAVAAHLEPEILLVDEVLAVGDAAFQKKCLGKMSDVSRHGRTVLFVSHNMTAMRSLCQRVIWMRDGQIADDGEAASVIDRYLQQNKESRLDSVWETPESAPGDDRVRLHRVRVIPRDGKDEITVHTPLQFEFSYWNYVPGAVLNVAVFLNNLEETCIFNITSEWAPRPAGLIRHVVDIPGDFLNTGIYYLRVMVVVDASRPILDYTNAVSFEVHEGEREGNWFGRIPGAVRPKFHWETAAVDVTCEKVG
jgi:lipopolysaccharide transport system ATP-binding protein